MNEKILIFCNSYKSIINSRYSLLNELLKEKKLDIYSFEILQKNKTNFKINKMNFFSFVKIISKSNILENCNLIFSYNLKSVVTASLLNIFLKKKHIVMITGLGNVFLRKSLKNYFLQYFVLIFYKLFLKNTYHIFFQNSDNYKFFKTNNIITNQNFSITGASININNYELTNFNNLKKISFVMAARAIPEKGIEEYMYASSKVIFNNSNYNVKFYLFTSKNNYITKLLLKYKLNNCANFILKEWSYNLKDDIKNLHIGVLPSYGEGTSFFLLQALAMGKPIITTDVFGCKNLVKDNGFLCKPRDPENLYHYFVKMINSKNKFGLFGENSRILIKENFDSSVVNKKILKYFS